jgi:hypothetical protein
LEGNQNYSSAKVRQEAKIKKKNYVRLASCPRHSTTLQCMRLTDHVSLNCNNNMSTAAVLLDIETAFWQNMALRPTMWLSELQF